MVGQLIDKRIIQVDAGSPYGYKIVNGYFIYSLRFWYKINGKVLKCLLRLTILAYSANERQFKLKKFHQIQLYLPNYDVQISRVEYITVIIRHLICHVKWLGRVNLCRRIFAVNTVRQVPFGVEAWGIGKYSSTMFND